LASGMAARSVRVTDCARFRRSAGDVGVRGMAGPLDCEEIRNEKQAQRRHQEPRDQAERRV